MSPRKPRDRVLRPKHFVEQDTFFTPIVTSEVTLRPEHFAADDAFPTAAAVVDPKTLADLLTALKVLRWANIGPGTVMDAAITAVHELQSIRAGADRGRESQRKKSKSSDEIIIRCRALVGRTGLSKSAAALHVLAKEFPELSGRELRIKADTARKKI